MYKFSTAFSAVKPPDSNASHSGYVMIWRLNF